MRTTTARTRQPLARHRAPAALAEQQAGALSRAQLGAAGVDAQAVRLQVAAGRWQLVGPLAVVVHTGPLTTAARRWASALTAGPAGALGAWTALEVHGLTGWERDRVHVVVPRGADPPDLPWWTVHESRRHRAEDVRHRDALPVHTVERAAVDAAAWTAQPRAAVGLLAAVVQQRLTTPARLVGALAAAGRVRHRPLLLAALEDLAGGSRSTAEVDLVQLCRRHALPVPRRQVRRADATGRSRYLDAEWVLPDGRRVLAEVDGALHAEVGRWCEDALRAAELARPGEVLLRLPALLLRTEEARVVAVLRRHLSP